MKCKNCNCELDGGYSSFCSKCGARQDADSIAEPAAAPSAPPTKEKKGNSTLIILLIFADSVLLVAGVIIAAYFGLFNSLFGSDKSSGRGDKHGHTVENSAGDNGNGGGLLSLLFGDDITDIPSASHPSQNGATVETAPTLEETEPTIEETAPIETEPVETEPPETEPAETDPPETTPPEPVWEGSSRVVIANGGLNMRSSPSLSAGIINCIPNGNIITVERVQDNWAYVSYGGGYGWCSCDYLFVPIEIDASPIYTATVRCHDKIEMVSEGYAKDDVVYTDVYNGTVVSVYEIDGDRAFIKYNNIYGWCSKAYLELY